MQKSDNPLVSAIALAALAFGGIVGVAVARTWTSAHTTWALGAAAVILAVFAVGASNALGVALAERRPAGVGSAAPPPAAPTVLLGQGGAGALGMEAKLLMELLDTRSRIEERDRRARLEDWRPPASSPAAPPPAMGYGAGGEYVAVDYRAAAPLDPWEDGR